jgi:LmbE family N-acetylglucosaminyl deacetylase
VLAENEVSRVLVVTAHPDDVDFGAAGTIATWVSQGVSVTYCVVTDGNAGGSDREVSRDDIPAIRRAEQTAAAACCGVTDVRFLGYIDGELVVSQDLRRDISRVIRQVRPDRMLIQSPERNWARIGASHPDHLAAGEGAIQAVYPDARNPFAHPVLLQDEGLEPWTVREVWLMADPAPDHWVDVTEHFDVKVEAIRSHVSQMQAEGDVAVFVKEWMAGAAKAGGLDEGRLAEAFRVVTTG